MLLVSFRYGDSDEHYFLDFDMQVLGWDEADYDRYAEQIRQEYIHVPEQQYRTARAQVTSLTFCGLSPAGGSRGACVLEQDQVSE